MEATALPINMDNLRATGRMAEKQMNVALEQAELNGEVIPQEVMNFLKVFQFQTILLICNTISENISQLFSE